MDEFLDIFSANCDDIDCNEYGAYEKEVTVRDAFNEPFSFTAFFCAMHKDGAHTAWDNLLVEPAASMPKEREALRGNKVLAREKI